MPAEVSFHCNRDATPVVPPDAESAPVKSISTLKFETSISFLRMNTAWTKWKSNPQLTGYAPLETWKLRCAKNPNGHAFSEDTVCQKWTQTKEICIDVRTRDDGCVPCLSVFSHPRIKSLFSSKQWIKYCLCSYYCRTNDGRQTMRAFYIECWKIERRGRKDSNLKLCDWNDLMLLFKKICLCWVFGTAKLSSLCPAPSVLFLESCVSKVGRNLQFAVFVLWMCPR